MDTASLFGLLAGIMAFITYCFYFRQTIKGQSTPNPATWAIWLMVGIINTFTYFSVVGDNIWKTSLAIVVTSFVLIIFIYSLIKGKFSKISRLEIFILIAAIIIGTFWQVTSNDRISNMLLQGVYVISYIPTVSGLIKGKAKEYPTAWIMAIIAYFLSTLSVVINFSGDWVSLLFPLVNGLLGNGTILAIIYLKKFKKNNQK